MTVPFVLLLWAMACKDSDQDGVRNGQDCAPDDPAVSPDASEQCNGRDDDCNGQIDEDVAILAFFDGDGDGYGDTNLARRVCTLPVDGTTLDGDCDDDNAAVSPGTTEICDEVDNDCDSTVDEDVTLVFYVDDDGDGHGTEVEVVEGCAAPDGFAAAPDDCDDDDGLAWTDAVEACDNHDNDCNGLADEGVPLVRVWVDADGDGAGDPNNATVACGALPGFSADDRDCDDSDPAVGPDAVDVQGDGVDTDCDGFIDEFGIPLPFATLNEALAAAPPGAVVQFDEGEFEVEIDLTGTDIVLAGEGCAYTTLVGLGTGSVVQMDRGVLTGLTLTGGVGTPSIELEGETQGGGLHVLGDVLATDVCFSSNFADKRGGGFAVDTGTLTLIDAVISDNEAETQGGGGWVGRRGNLVATRVVFRENVSFLDGGGGGGLVVHGGKATVRNALFIGNTGAHGGGVRVLPDPNAEDPLAVASLDLKYATFHGNTNVLAEDPGQALVLEQSDLIMSDVAFTGHFGTAGVYDTLDGTEVLARLAFADNEAADDSSGWRPDALRARDPGYISASSSRPADWDLRWLPGAAWVDAGDPADTDVDGSPADIGAWGGPSAWVDGPATQWADEDLDGMLDSLEQHYGLNHWVDDAAEDPDGDGLSNLEEVDARANPFANDTDFDGISDRDEVNANTNPDASWDQRPNADAGADRLAAVGEPVSIDASGSWDPNAETLEFAWTLLPAPGSSLAGVDDPTVSVASFTPDVAGVWTLTVTVSDGFSTHSDAVVVTSVLSTIVPDDVATVAEAVLLAPSGTGIALRPGTYAGSVDLGAKSLALFGLGDPNEVVIDGAGQGPVVQSIGASTLSVANLTIRNGQAENGAGLSVDGTLNLLLFNVVFEDNLATGDGGAIYANGAAVVAHDVVTRRGFANRGGGLYHANGSLEVFGWVSDSDEALKQGGAFALDEVPSQTPRFIFSATVHNARAPQGAGLDYKPLWPSNDLFLANAVFSGAVGDDLINSGGGAMNLFSIAVVDNDVGVVLEGDDADWFVSGSIESGNIDAVLHTDEQVAAGFSQGKPAFLSLVGDHDLTTDHFAAFSPPRIGAIATADVGFADHEDPDGSPADPGPLGGANARLAPRNVADTDGDGLPDAWESAFGLNAADPLDGSDDPDSDGLDNAAEFQFGTLPDRADSDLDGVTDVAEVVSGDSPADDRDHRPMAEFEPFNQAVTLPTTLSAADGSDPDGLPLSYSWKLADQPATSGINDGDITGVSSPTAAFTPDALGVFRFELVVNDGTASSPVRFATVVTFAILRVPEDYPTVDEAIAAASENDVVEIGTGSYVTAFNQLVDNLTVFGQGVGLTELVGAGGTSVVSLDKNESLALRDLTVTQGDGENGGAVHCSQGTLIAERVRFERNMSRDGGALWMDLCTTTLTDVDLVDNDASGGGGGAYFSDGTLDWTRGQVHQNLCRGVGGGLKLMDTVVATIRNVEFLENVSEGNGSAIHLGGSVLITPTVTLEHITVAHNHGVSAAVHMLYGNLTVSESLFVGNEGYGIHATGLTIITTGVRNGYWDNELGATTPSGLGATAPDSILLDPRFVDEAVGDLRLLPPSPMRDAGSGTDPDGTLSDLGAFGGVSASPAFDDWYGDTDGDGLPDGWELQYGFDPALADGPADADGDGLDSIEEAASLTDPFDDDSDHDGVNDGEEAADGDDPADPLDHGPVVDCGADSERDPSELVTLTATANDPDGGAKAWSWRFVELPGRSALDDGDISGATTANPSFVLDAAGRFVLEATATVAGGVGTDEVAVTARGDVWVPEDYADVASAVFSVAPGGRVVVGAGTWPCTVTLAGKDAHIVGAGRESTILDGGGYAVIRAVESETLVLEDLSLTGAFSSAGAIELATIVAGTPAVATLNGVGLFENHGVVGGAISVNGSELTGDDILITDNHATRLGGGVYALTESDVVLTHALVAGNDTSTFSGGAFYVLESDLVLSNSIVHGNISNGGGAFHMQGGSISLDFTTVTNNVYDGGGSSIIDPSVMDANAGDVTLLHSIIAFNDGETALNCDVNSTLTWSDLLMWSNVTHSDGCGAGFVPDFEVDPLFVNVDADPDWSENDWALAAGSPAIGAGDLAGEAVDLGAFGGPNGFWP